MESLSLLKCRQLAISWLDSQLQKELNAAADEEQRRLLRTHYARQKNALEYLSLIQMDMGKPAASGDIPELGKALRFAAHPLTEVVLMAALMTFVLTDMQLPAVAAGVAASFLALLRLTHPALRQRTRPVVPEVHEPFVDAADMDRFLHQQTDRILQDAQSIAERQTVKITRERQDVGADAVEMYCALYEAALDIPDPQLLAYPLSVLKMTLLERGLEPVGYTPETAALFDIMPADCPEGMRWPAIRSRENGVVHKRGLYFMPGA